MKLSRLSQFLVVALPLAACTGTNFSGGNGAPAAERKAGATNAPDSASPSTGGPGDQTQDNKDNTIYVPVGGTKSLGSSGPCSTADATIAACKNGVITGNKIGTTTIPGAGSPNGIGSTPGSGSGTDTKVVVYDPKNPPPGVDSSGNKAGGVDSKADQSGAAGSSSDCLAARADNYNIMMIFDNSGSQATTDPTVARRDGAKLFVDQWEQFVAAHKSSRVYMGVLSFNTVSVRAAQGWILLDGTNGDAIKTEITTATNNPDGGTAYSPPLTDAASFFQQVNTLPNADRQRNYAVFLTDGIPNAAEATSGGNTGVAAIDNASALMRANPPDCIGNGQGCNAQAFDSVLVERMSDITTAVNNLVTNFGVAIYALATGPDVPDAAQPIVQGLAQPQTGVKFPDHVGKYFRAKTSDDLKTVWSTLFDQLGKCN